jgi:FkbM family methyltransferase
MSIVSRIAEKVKKQKSDTVESTLETIIGKLYVRLGTFRSPLNFQVNRKKVSVHHGKRWDHLFAIYQCFYKNQYSLPKSQFVDDYHRLFVDDRYHAILASGATPLIVDCGANIGASAVWLSAHYPEAKIVAIEPFAENLALLKRNVAGLNVDIIEGAVGPADGVANLDASVSDSLGQRVTAEGGGQAVQVRSLRSLIARYENAEPFFLKIDIEGAEKDLFEHDWEVFDQFPIIAIEPHDFAMPGRRTSAAFFRFHGDRARDFLFAHENIFSIKYQAADDAETPPASKAPEVQTSAAGGATVH